VDDERGIRIRVREFLRGKGFEVGEAEDARTAESEERSPPTTTRSTPRRRRSGPPSRRGV
jgi:hypothetical protein